MKGTGALLLLTLGSGLLVAGVTHRIWLAHRVRSRLPRPPAVRPARSRSGPRFVPLAAALHRADVGLPPEQALRMALMATAVAAAIGAAVGGFGLAVIGAAATGGAGPLGLRMLAGRRERRADHGLPVVLDDVARALRGGVPPVSALAHAADGNGPRPARDDLRAVVEDVRAGLGLVDALERWRTRRPSTAVRATVAALAMGTATGGARSRAVEAVAASLRESQAVRAEATALATQARSSAVVVTAAPIGFAVLVAATDTDALAFLVGTPVGLTCITLGLVLDGVGGWWMHRIVRAP